MHVPAGKSIDQTDAPVCRSRAANVPVFVVTRIRSRVPVLVDTPNAIAGAPSATAGSETCHFCVSVDTFEAPMANSPLLSLWWLCSPPNCPQAMLHPANRTEAASAAMTRELRILRYRHTGPGS